MAALSSLIRAHRPLSKVTFVQSPEQSKRINHRYSWQLFKGPEAGVDLARSRNRKEDHVTASVSKGESYSSVKKSNRAVKSMVKTLILIYSEMQSYWRVLSKSYIN